MAGGRRGSINWWGEVCSDCMNAWRFGGEQLAFLVTGYRLESMYAVHHGRIIM